MFGSALVKMNSSYLNNNSYGSSFNMSYSYTMPSMSFNSVFSMGMNCPTMSYFPMAYAPAMPIFGGGCCGGFNNFGYIGIMPFMQNFMDMLTAFSTLNTTTNIIDEAKNTNISFNPFKSWIPSSNKNTSLKKESSDVKKSSANYTFHTSSFNTKTNLPALKDVGYNSDKGYELAKAAAGNAVGFTHQCAKYVRIALENTGLSNGQRGDGYEYAKILSNNNNFKEVSSSNINLSSLPAGCILVYDKGVAGYDSSAGHVEITLGNGKAVSDGVTNNIRAGARVFVPV